MPTLYTLGELTSSWGQSLDVARMLLRRDPSLAVPVVQRGKLRLFSEQGTEELRRALAERREKQARSVMAPAMAG